jgi:hypothetical protein
MSLTPHLQRSPTHPAILKAERARGEHALPPAAWGDQPHQAARTNEYADFREYASGIRRKRRRRTRHSIPGEVTSRTPGGISQKETLLLQD